jgi:hypothetical protein
MHLNNPAPRLVKIAKHLASGARHFSFVRLREMRVSTEEDRRQEPLLNQRWVLTAVE